MNNSGPIPKRKAPKIFLSKDQITKDELAAQRVHLSEETLEAYQRAMNPGYPFWHRVGRFLKAENKAGRKAKTLKDFALAFLPWGRQISTASEFITTAIIDEKTMDKPKHKSKTIWGAAIVALTAILNALGMDFVNDPQTMQTIYTMLYALAGALGLYGLRDAVGKLKSQDNE